MCLGVPVKVLLVDRNDNVAIVDNSGVELRVNISLLSEVSVGEYVMIHAGFAIGKVDLAEARESLKVWKEFIEYVSTYES
ncbi:HypC/HybG/HupF family hydrogenase formation chaperone [Desulfosporosinus sp. Sb-LF]|uniref:HypC/HybG/HupF family hydrogenase formation chaperone n=1 Tax=Desulfosporosinus sp. Sb-LF TaxID=2560027 RepID=UPI00107F3D0C|nr:HypC/HybG/HupF family hydrogenase formation chaperone [Desulfosporosinus sp. Sb-LF]TGE31110.1 HypC/HybG/HupF family hydrogenase formation chaperone [Desulfosporosinus sp. Sb-LF]